MLPLYYLTLKIIIFSLAKHLAHESQYATDETEVGITEGAAGPCGVESSQCRVG